MSRNGFWPSIVSLSRRLPRLPRIPLLLIANRWLAIRPIDFDTETEYGFRLTGNTEDVIQRYVFVFGFWEPNISTYVAASLSPGDAVLDIGANIGYFSLLASKLVGESGLVVAVEPVPSTVERLKLHVRLNAAANVRVEAAALGDKAGSIEIFRAGVKNLGNSTTRPTEPGFISEGEVPMVIGDSLLSHEETLRLKLIKIDTEGDEFVVLRGLRQLLTAAPAGALVMVEVDPSRLAARSEKGDIIEFMRGHGFTPYTIENSYRSTRYAIKRVHAPVPLTEPLTILTDLIFVKA